MFHRQARMAGLVMAQGYSRHHVLLGKMDIQATKSLDDLAKHVANRRHRDMERATKRRGRKVVKHDTGYNKENLKVDDEPEPSILKSITEKLIKRIEHVDIESGKDNTNYKHVSFIELAKYRLMAPAAVKFLMLSSNSQKRPSKTMMKNATKTPVFEPWPIFAHNAQKKLFESNLGRAVKSCGLYICKDHKFLAAKPDGLIVSENAVFRVLKPWENVVKYYTFLAQIDMECTGMDMAYLVLPDNGIDIIVDKIDPLEIEKLTKFFYDHVLIDHARKYYKMHKK
jgi:hypothetical protein